jgi:nitroimidazol reductase NimA-like FMN-containing flavoprotein (pyridoxamine 5'-phosphate oxidase superfamily)
VTTIITAGMTTTMMTTTTTNEERTVAKPRMTEEEVWAFVTDAHTGIMTTLRRDGVPISLPLWFACLDRTIYLQTRGKKLQRIGNDSRASFLVESGERWADLKAVHLTGTAEAIEPGEELARRFRAELDRKYAAFRTPSEQMPAATAEFYAKEMRGFVRFTPDARALNWDNTKLAQ